MKDISGFFNREHPLEDLVKEIQQYAQALEETTNFSIKHEDEYDCNNKEDFFDIFYYATHGYMTGLQEAYEQLCQRFAIPEVLLRKYHYVVKFDTTQPDLQLDEETPQYSGTMPPLFLHTYLASVTSQSMQKTFAHLQEREDNLYLAKIQKGSNILCYHYEPASLEESQHGSEVDKRVTEVINIIGEKNVPSYKKMQERIQKQIGDRYKINPFLTALKNLTPSKNSNEDITITTSNDRIRMQPQHRTNIDWILGYKPDDSIFTGFILEHNSKSMSFKIYPDFASRAEATIYYSDEEVYKKIRQHFSTPYDPSQAKKVEITIEDPQAKTLKLKEIKPVAT